MLTHIEAFKLNKGKLLHEWDHCEHRCRRCGLTQEQIAMQGDTCHAVRLQSIPERVQEEVLI